MALITIRGLGCMLKVKKSFTDVIQRSDLIILWISVMALVTMQGMNQNEFKVEEWVSPQLCRFFLYDRPKTSVDLFLWRNVSYLSFEWLIQTSMNFHWHIRWFSNGDRKWQWTSHQVGVPTWVGKHLLLFLLYFHTIIMEEKQFTKYLLWSQVYGQETFISSLLWT